MKTNFLVPAREQYTCEHCQELVAGGRYNNHCPTCLWSKHLDDEVPGDRQSDCAGMMRPIGVVQKGVQLRIIQKCERCGKIFTVDSAKDDNFEIIIKLSQSS